ncbi:FAD-binding domain-containing protein 23 [Elsinoe fawcettii]|nr:FAD-binding domain-containing protein 23 [Elsinoe fawcettii]
MATHGSAIGPLNVVVIGAGLGGLSAAVALRKVGHHVTVYEAAKELVTAGAGIQIPPPSTRILKRWGLDKALEPYATIPETWTFRHHQDDHLLGSMPLNPFCSDRYGSPWWCIHRADYQRTLYEVAIALGATINLDHRITSLDPSTSSFTVQSATPTTSHKADLIIAADGLRSTTRSILFPSHPGPTPTTICAYRALVPLNPNTRLEKTTVEVHLGPSLFSLSYPVRPLSPLQNIVLGHPLTTSPTDPDPPRFPRPASIPTIASHYASFSPAIRETISQLEPEEASSFFLPSSSLDKDKEDNKGQILEWRLSDLPPSSAWSSENGTVVLLGDAAHAALPFMSAGASMAVEDAACLASLLRPEVVGRKGVRGTVKAYEEIRKARAEEMGRLSRGDAASWGLHGEEAERRDEVVSKMGGEEWKEVGKRLREEGLGEWNFGDLGVMDWAWGYDVLQDVERYLSRDEGRE